MPYSSVFRHKLHLATLIEICSTGLETAENAGRKEQATKWLARKDQLEAELREIG